MRSAVPRRGVTEAHRRTAFDLMAWAGWTYEQAMADEVRSRIVKLRARHICKTETQATRRTVVPIIDTRPSQVHQTDCKRATAGDRDD